MRLSPDYEFSLICVHIHTLALCHRVHSAAHYMVTMVLVNPKSIWMCSEIGAEIPECGEVHDALKQIQNEQNLRKTYRQTDKYKTQRVTNRNKIIYLHEEHQNKIFDLKNAWYEEIGRVDTTHIEHNYAQQNRIE